MVAIQPSSHESRSEGIVVCGVVMITVSTLAVILRFWSRALTTSLVFWWDDWAILFTLVSIYDSQATGF